MTLLEERLEAAEMRAAKTEEQVKQLQTQQAAEIRETKTVQNNTPANGQSTTESGKRNATPLNLLLSGYGDLKIYGDIGFNMDTESNHGLLVVANAGVNSDPTNEQWNLNDRILLGFDGIRRLGNGYFAGFSTQPLGDIHGSVNIDNAVFLFDKENGWRVKVGRSEVYDIFPLNQSTFAEHFGNTMNDLYDDGSGYIYMMKEGRGRSNIGGNFLVNKQLGNWYFKLNTLLEDGTSLYNDGNYHGRDIEQRKNVAYLRPAIAWSLTGEFTVSTAMEANVTNNAHGYTDSRDNFIDQSDRTGYDMSMTWSGLKAGPGNGIMVGLNIAYLDANNEKDFAAGINALWKRFELGYIYAHNKIDEFSGMVCGGNYWINDERTYNIRTIHASYRFANMMDIGSFSVYLGTYYSILNSNGDKIYGDDSDDRYGARVRFRYFF